jgi:trans-aconitate methyltransferase
MKSFFYYFNNFTSFKLTGLKIANIIIPIMSSSNATSNYERMSGNCTRILAAQIISNIEPPTTSSSIILDNACGPGIVSEQIKLLYPEVKILSTDIAPGMVEEVQQAIKANG